MNKQAKNMEVIYNAKKIHDAECPWKQEGRRVCMNPFDIERMGWEEGDNIAGLIVVADTGVVTGMLRVECDGDPDAGEPEITEAVSKDNLVTV